MIRQAAPALALAAGLLLTLMIAALLFAPAGGLERLPAGTPFLPPSLTHPFGTDDLGRDMLRATAQGARTSLLVGAGVCALALGLGVLVGLLAGLGPHLLDDVLMRLADAVASLPALLVAILVAALFGGAIAHLVLVLGLLRWPLMARLVRAEAATLRRREFVRAAQALGVPPLRIAIRHVLPQAATVARAGAGIVFGGAVAAEASLAFVGLGDPAVTSLGQLAANGFAFVFVAPWMWLAPVAVMVLAAAAVAVLTDAGAHHGAA